MGATGSSRKGDCLETVHCKIFKPKTWDVMLSSEHRPALQPKASHTGRNVELWVFCCPFTPLNQPRGDFQQEPVMCVPMHPARQFHLPVNYKERNSWRTDLSTAISQASAMELSCSRSRPSEQGNKPWHDWAQLQLLFELFGSDTEL